MEGPVLSITHQLLSTQITSLNIKDNFVFIGEGQHCHVHDVVSGKRVSSIQVFRASVIHGIQVQLPPPDHGSLWLVVLFGQKSLAVMCFEPTLNKCCLLVEEECFEDWIVDAVLENDFLHLVIATAHNSLLRCQLQCLLERCRKLLHTEKVTEGKDASNVSIADKPDIFSRVSQDACCLEGTHEKLKSKSMSDRSCQKPSMLIVARADCAEKCVLFSGHVVMISGSWESAVLLAGTASQLVMIWGPWGAKDNLGRVLPLHHLRGHEGSIFSIRFCSKQNLITTTSDDRSLRVWEVRHVESYSGSPHDVAVSQINSEKGKAYWRHSRIVEKLKCYGHGARVWRSLILPSFLLSVGEDSKVCVWNPSGTLVTSWKAHDGASIWSITASETAGRIVTGGGDGSVKSWSLNATAAVSAKSLENLPWSQCVPASGDKSLDGKVLYTASCCKDVTDQKESSILNSDGITEEGQEFCSDFSLFQNDKSEVLKICENNFSGADFPRCVSLIGISMVLVIMNSGKLYSFNFDESSWQLQYEDKELKNYAVMEVGPDSKCVAVGTLAGKVIILQLERGTVSPVVSVVGSGKVFALQWLTSARVLVLGSGGLMTTWEMQYTEGKANWRSMHSMPVSMHRWLCAVYVYGTQTTVAAPHLVCGDRAGSLHLYSLDQSKPKHTLRSIHGRNGVTSLTFQRGLVYSSGRDGCVRCLAVREGSLQVLTVTRVSNVNWVSKLIFLYGKPLAICFHGVKLKVWNLEEDRAVVEMECGGAHRSWDLQVSEAEDRLVCLFLKDGLPYTFTTTLTDKFLPQIKAPVNTLETTSLKVLFQSSGEIVFVTGGEDTTLRLHTLPGPRHHQPLAVVRSHLSSIRTLCLIEEIKEMTGAVNSDGTVWMVSAGGRAELKVWMCSLDEYTEKNSNHQQTHDSLPNEQLNNKSGLNSTLVGDLSQLQSLNITCREARSHMLRTGSHKTWRSQHLTLDPETRYMDATAFWVSQSLALVVLASSDGLLRIFSFTTESEKIDQVCAIECGRCLLKVARLTVLQRTILVTSSTKGIVTFWDLQAVVDWCLLPALSDSACNHSPPSPPQPQKLTSVIAHQSGVNSLAFYYQLRISENSQPITMATGGDDNKLSVWKVVVNKSVAGNIAISVTNQCNVFGHASQVSGLNWLSREHLISCSIDQRLIIWRFCSASSQHYTCKFQTMAQNEASMNVCETSESYEIPEEEAAVKEPNSLIPELSCFTGVSDVKGITIMDIDKSDQDRKAQKKIFVYGTGLQVFDVTVGSK